MTARASRASNGTGSDEIFDGYQRIDKFEPESVERIGELYGDILKAIGEDPEREGLKRTPERVAKSLQYLTHGYDLDPAAIEMVPGGSLRRAVSVTVKRSLVTGGPPQPGYIRTLNEYDCGQWRMRWQSFTVYSRFGVKVMTQVNPDPAWAPSSFEGEASLKMVCNGTHGDSAVAAQSMGQLVLALMSAWDADAPMPPLQSPPKPPKPAAPAKPPKR